MTPSAGKLFVRSVETPETLGAGKILLTAKTRADWTWGQMEVVGVGAPAYCDDEDCERPHIAECGADGEEIERRHPTSVRVGDWVLLKSRAMGETHVDGLYVCQMDDVLAILTAE